MGFLLARQPATVLFSILIIILCLFGMLMSLQMAIVLGRFSIQNFIWEWRLRGIEQSGNWRKPRLFVDLHRFRDQHTPLEQPGSDPPDRVPVVGDSSTPSVVGAPGDQFPVIFWHRLWTFSLSGG